MAKDKQQQQQQNKRSEKITRNASEALRSKKSDPQGSYTGNPVDGGRPVQDADDL